MKQTNPPLSKNVKKGDEDRGGWNLNFSADSAGGGCRMSKSKASMTKDDYIKAEIKRLKKIFANLTQDASAVAEKLIENAAFMAVSLTDLQRIINEKGYTEEYQNGENQFGTKKSSEVDIYNTMVKNFNATMKQLIDMLPESPSGSNSKNAALDYITRRAGP